MIRVNPGCSDMLLGKRVSTLHDMLTGVMLMVDAVPALLLPFLGIISDSQMTSRTACKPRAIGLVSGFTGSTRIEQTSTVMPPFLILVIRGGSSLIGGSGAIPPTLAEKTRKGLVFCWYFVPSRLARQGDGHSLRSFSTFSALFQICCSLSLYGSVRVYALG